MRGGWMMRGLGLLALGAALGTGLGPALEGFPGAGAALAEAPLPRFSAADPAALAAVEQARGPLLLRVRANGLPVEVESLRLDLNGDGEPEILARLSTPRGCAPLGRADCPMLVLQRQADGRHLEIGTFFADRVRLTGERSQGWQDLEMRFVNGPWRRAAWNGTLYRSTRR